VEDNRERFLRKQGAELRQLDARIRELELEARVAKVEIRDSIEKAIDEAKRKRAEINYRLDTIARTGSNAWKDIKKVVSSTKKEIHRIVRRSRYKIENA
jgi:hypothetical protein